MKKLFPNFVYSRGYGLYRWTGRLKPTEISPNYKVEIDCFQSSPPKIWVLDPILEGNKHRFKDGSLCLYFHKDPKDQRWTENSIIARTIIPWTATWLFCYEIWLETGIWLNEEAPHDDPKEEN